MVEFFNLLLFTSFSDIGIIILDSQIRKLRLKVNELPKFRQQERSGPGLLTSGPKLFLSVSGFREGFNHRVLLAMATLE